MAANSFEEILSNFVSDETDREALGSLAGKYPEIKNGWLRQSDYSRKMDSLRDTEKKVQEWDQWADKYWDHEADMTKAEKNLLTELQGLKEKQGSEMTFDEVKAFTEKAFSEKGVVTKSVFDTELANKTKEVGDGLQGMAAFNTLMLEKMGNHLHEFKEPLKVREFVGKLGELDPDHNIDRAYDKYVAESRADRDKTQQAKREEDIKAKAYEEAEAKLQEKYAAGRNGLPVDQVEDGLGHLQSKMQRVGDPDALEKASLGDGSTARVAAAAWRKDQIGK